MIIAALRLVCPDRLWDACFRHKMAKKSVKIATGGSSLSPEVR
jgi:hypothetical protein